MQVLQDHYEVMNGLFCNVTKLKKANENKDRLVNEAESSRQTAGRAWPMEGADREVGGRDKGPRKREKDPQVDAWRYNTFTHYYSNRATLGESESPTEDTTAQTSSPTIQEVGAETALEASTSEATETPHVDAEEAFAEVEVTQETLNLKPKSL
ncbi:hypothetical protein CRG98_032099 [Punica granatum]|uniref:Uncharacterized protein n=1 Tax=Punica granatum TaxID=22663 RepID=A0A2I0IU35_PUNGR|nr:hypothetical protein CRG98_032099 [Punica granatum]